MQDSRNMIIAIVLSIVVLFGWQYFVVGPQMERAQKQAQIAAEQAKQGEAAIATPTNAASSSPSTTTPAADGTAANGTTAPANSASKGLDAYPSREAALAASARVRIDTPDLSGSIDLAGARLDDLELKHYHETVDDNSPTITLLSPAGFTGAYFAEQGWAAPEGTDAKVPDGSSVWTVDSNASVLTPSTPVTLRYDNGAGLVFKRTFAVDDNYLFTVTQSVTNNASTTVSLFPYSRIARYGTPNVRNFFVQHEGPLGVLGSNNLISKKYSDVEHDKQIRFDDTTGWLGITDKYWATTVIAQPGEKINALFSWRNSEGFDDYQTSFVGTKAVTLAPGATGTSESYVFAGAKEESVIASYESEHHFDRLELLIDWGWFFFFTKPLFSLLRFLYGFLGNFGLATMAVTVIVKALFFPLANRSYASMAAMRRVQPEMKLLQERFKDDRAALQKATMELYQKEKINPLSGCWPILIQIPVFYSLYTVIFISLEMRHAPFFGWIQDLASPDPTNVFTLFGLIPWDPTILPVLGGFLHLGVWPLLMGITMWLQMRLNPPPPDPTQAMLFNFMPIIFTFMLGTFPAGLVIYWAWNNTLSITQQYIIMKRHGAEVDLFGNVLASLGLRKTAEQKSGK